MYHLFNSVYVQSEAFMDPPANQINISENTGYVKAQGMSQTILGEQLGYATSLSALTVLQFKELMEKAVNFQHKLFFFVDEDTYISMYGIMLKAIFPNIEYKTFKRFFICKKAALDVMNLNFFTSVSAPTYTAFINEEKVATAYEKYGELAKVLREILIESSENLSLEWRIVKLLATGDFTTLPETLNEMIKRLAVCYAQDAAAEWGGLITDESLWETAGCSEESLLHSSNTFAGCLRLPILGESALHLPGALKIKGSPAWFVELLRQSIIVLEEVGETTMVRRANALLPYLVSSDSLNTTEGCLELIKVLFSGGKNSIGIPREDSAKYDVNLIRYILTLDDDTLAKLSGDAIW